MDYYLTDLQLDTIKEIMNIGVNNSTNLLSHILKTSIELNIPIIKFCSTKDLMMELRHLGAKELTAVNMEFQGIYNGISQLVISQENASKLVSIFTQNFSESSELDEIKAGALIEIGNIVLNAVLAEFSNLFKYEMEFFVPNFYENYELDFYSKINNFSDDVVLLGQTLFLIEKYNITGDILIFMKVDSFRKFIKLIDDYLRDLK